LKQISKELYKELEKLNLIDTTKGFANCYTTCRNKKAGRKKKYICESVLMQYEKMIRNKNKNKNKG
jgi:hypothetical protein